LDQWKTLSRNDADFLPYLTGSFSDLERALPVRSLNVDSALEVITFRIVPLSEISRPGLLMLFWLLMRPLTLVLSIGPLLTVFLECWTRKQSIDLGLAASSFLGIICFQVALNLFNDYFDHIRGKDRLSLRGGSRAIQNGWVRALSVKRAAWGLLGLAILMGVPIVAFRFSFFVAIAVVALLTGLELGLQRFGLKYKGFGELMAFALTGPLLTTGYAWALTGTVTMPQMILGFIFGSVSLLYFHSANFENIMPDNQAGIMTWATRTGFDASKQFFYFTSLLVVGSTLLLAWSFQYEWRLILVAALQAAFLFRACQRVRFLASPLSSQLVGLRRIAIQLNWLSLALLGGVFLWMR
jgi:1,4-dihydroxy-2-naphthoate octaprenyltransferase